MRLSIIPAFALLSTTPLFAHVEQAIVMPERIWRAWSFEPVVIVLLLLSAFLYGKGLADSRFAAAPRARRWAFASGWLFLLISQISPLHQLGATLFSAHMTQHELLMLVAAPLLVFSRPLPTFLWALPLHARSELGELAKRPWFAHTWQAITQPLVAWTVHAIALWVWHIPTLYEATLHSEFVHALQHASFLITALLFWWALMHEQRMRNYGASVAYIFTTAVHNGALGGLMTFASNVWYPAYAGRAEAWGFTPLEDQQLGGLIMWVPSGLVFLAIGLWLFWQWMQESERRVLLSSAAADRR